MSSTIIKVLGFSGSLRKASYHTALLNHAIRLSPPHIQIDIFDLSPIPLYNEDVRIENGEPESVKKFKEKIFVSDALLIAVPEYNYSLTGVLKNAIDWASRPVDSSPLNEKPFAMMSTGGILGGARAQYHMRQIAVFTNMHPINKPELLIPKANENFDKEGNFIDPKNEDRIINLLESLYGWTLKLK
jgi:chromate reductase